MVRAKSVSVPAVANLNAVGIVTTDLAASVRLGNQLSLAFECDSPGEVEAQLEDPDGVPVDLYAAL